VGVANFSVPAKFVRPLFSQRSPVQTHLGFQDYQSSLRGIVTEQSAGNAKLIICLDNNTQVLGQCRDELRLCRTEKGKL